MNVPEIQEVKKHLDVLKQKGLVKEWELPYENILTRRSAAIFFLTTTDQSKNEEIWKELNEYPGFDYRENTEQKLSNLNYRITFDKGFVLGKGYVNQKGETQ